MANQPPARPWFRLPNLARQSQPPPPPPPPEVVAPPPPQQPRIPIIRAAFRPAFTQSQPRPPPPQSTPSPPPTQPPLPISSPSPSPSPSPRLPRIATPSLISPSPSPPPSPPPQQPRIPVIRPAFRRTFTQPQPPPPPPTQSQPPLSVASPSPSPSPRLPRIATPPPPPPRPPMIAQLPTPTPSPKPPTKTTLSPPPITLPPPQTTSSKTDLNPKTLPVAEQEKVLLQDTFNKKVVFPASSHDQGSSIKGFLHKAANHSNKHHKKPSSSPSSDSEESKNLRIITMTGENKGALMELGLASRRNEGKTQIGNFPGNGHVLGNGLKETEDLNGGNADKSKMKDHKGKPMSGYVNSNVQGINNSILYNCSFTHHDPGVHFSVSKKKPINGGKGHTNEKKL